jgi:hypothetical protein
MQSDTNQSSNRNETKESPEPRPSLVPTKLLARRSFLRNLGLGAALLAPGAALLTGSRKAFAQTNAHGHLTRGDVAILQLLAAAELIEGDL